MDPVHPVKLSQFKVLTFDCYGTLIDWESGIWAALQPLLQATDHKVSREAALSLFGRIEPEEEHETPGLVYRELLVRVHEKMAASRGLPSSPALDTAFGQSVPNWPPFPDTVEALAYLKQHFKLVILSNVDRQSFTGTNKRLGVTFDAICTAEDVGSYKPSLHNFEYLLREVEKLGLAKADILHTAQSLYHDHVPAETFGLARCWINRRGDAGTGSGATSAVARMPKLDFQFPSLGAMAAAHRAETEQ
jgi:2-haloacid dehalogenase